MGGIRKRLLLSLLGSCAAYAIAAPAAQAGLSWNSAGHDFGAHNVGSPAPSKTFTLTATCDAASGVPPFICTVPSAGVHGFGLPAVNGAGFSLGSPSTCGASLATLFAGTVTTCNTTVNFTPSSAGATAGSLNLPAGPDIALSGTGIDPNGKQNGKKCKKGKKRTAAAAKKKKCKKKKKK